MKISFEKKIFLGFAINLLVVIASAWILISRFTIPKDEIKEAQLDWIELILFGLSFALLVVLYFIIHSRLRTDTVSKSVLFENKQLLQSIIDNTSNPIFIKKINGEYLLINKQCETLFHISNEEIVGKTDYDFLPKNVADIYRNSDLEVVKALRELKTEETVQLPDGAHTYISVKFPLYDNTGRIYAIGGISTDITERKKLEDTFRASNKLFNMAMDIMVIASNDKFVKINPALSKILGYSEEELLSKPFLDFIHPDDHESTHNEIAKLNMGAITIQFENRWITKNGSIRWLAWSATPDAPTGLLYAVARDITYQKDKEKTLVFADKFFNMSHDLLVVAKGDYFIKVNPAFGRTLGYTREDMQNKPFLFFAHPDDAKASEAMLKRLSKGEPIVNYRARALCKDGTYKWLDWSITIDLQTGLVYAVARDVTELMENDESLILADNFFKLTFDIIAVSKDEEFLKINPAFTKTLGYTQNDLNTIKFTELIHDDDKGEADQFIAKLLKGESVTNFKNRILCKDGTYKWVHWHSNFDMQQGVLYLVGRDITEQIKFEEEEHIAIDALYENQEKLRLILENIGDSVIVANADKKIILANNMANEFFGVKEDEKISADFINHFELYFPDGKTVFPAQNLPMERALKGEASNDVDIVLYNSNTNEKKRVLMTGKPVIDQNQNVVAAVVTIKDISKFKQLENDLKETETKYKQLIGFRKGDSNLEI